MRRLLLGLAFTTSIALSASANAQVADALETWHLCGSGPASNEAYIYDAANYGGTCRALFVGLYPNANTNQEIGSFGLNNDTLRSLKVGSGVRPRLFQDGPFAGSHFYFGPGSYPDISVYGWANITSSIRVEDESRSTACNDLVNGEFAVFRDSNYGDDCMVLHYGKRYPTPASMGIANDSISSVLGGPFVFCSGNASYSVLLWLNAGFGDPADTIHSGNNAASLPNFNDATSSISSLCQ